MICPKCGNEVQDGKKFCGKCGNKMEISGGAIQTNNVCPQCGAPVTPGKKFCGKCGAKLITSEETSAIEQNSAATDLVASAGFVYWNILPGQLAAKIDEKDIEQYKNIKGFVVQDGIKALFFADGKLIGELEGGKYKLSEYGVNQVLEQQSGVVNTIRRFATRIATFFTGKQKESLQIASSINVVLMRASEFPLIFSAKEVPAAGIRTEVGVHLLAKITNIIQFYQIFLLDSKFISIEKFSSSIETAIITVLEESLNGIDADAISSNAQIRQTVLNEMQTAVSAIYSFVGIEKIIRLTAKNAELEEIRRMKEELYISEKELVELSRRNDFLNRLNDEKNQQLLHEAQTSADFSFALNKIDEQNQLTEDEKARFADMLYWQRRLREATNEDEGNAALQKLEINGLIREEELATIKADISQRAKLKDLNDGQAIAMLTLQNNIALDQQKLQWEIEIGNKRIENELNRQRMQDEYADSRRRTEIELDKEEQLSQIELLRQAQAIRQEREDAEHKRKMEEENATRAHEITLTDMEQKHQEEMRRLFQNMSAEQIMAANPDISEVAANALAEKFKSQNAAEQIALMKEHKDEISRIMGEQQKLQSDTMQQMMQMMSQMFGVQNTRKDAEIDAIRKDANEHQDRMENIIKTQATAAYGAAGKIYGGTVKDKNDASHQSSRSNRKDFSEETCPSCGAAIAPGASFCVECGASL